MNREYVMRNSKDEIRKRIKNSKIKWLAPVLIVLVRPILAIFTQSMMALLLKVLNHPSFMYTATSWWTVYGTIIDIGCLLLLYRLLRAEGISIIDLVSFNRQKVINDILIGFGIFIFVFPLAMYSGSTLASLLVYGSLQPNLPEGALIRVLPMWAVLYSRSVWWIIWSFTEEVTYQGYALPRLQQISGRTWVAILWVGFGWALQHSFLPFINISHSIWLLIAFFPLAIVMQLIYLKYRRLLPLIIAHWAMDFVSVIFLVSNT